MKSSLLFQIYKIIKIKGGFFNWISHCFDKMHAYTNGRFQGSMHLVMGLFKMHIARLWKECQLSLFLAAQDQWILLQVTPSSHMESQFRIRASRNQVCNKGLWVRNRTCQYNNKFQIQIMNLIGQNNELSFRVWTNYVMFLIVYIYIGLLLRKLSKGN